jgi:hypothetical protein
MKGETRTIDRALLFFYKNTIISMIRWRFLRAGFFLKPENLLAPSESMGRGFLKELRFLNFPSTKLSCTRKQSISQLDQEYRRRRAPVPGPTSFTVSLAAYIEKVAGTCPLCGHDDDAEVSDDEEDELTKLSQ